MKLCNEKKDWKISPSLTQINEMKKKGLKYYGVKSRKKFFKKSTARAWIKKQSKILNFYIHDVFQKKYYIIYYTKLTGGK